MKIYCLQLSKLMNFKNKNDEDESIAKYKKMGFMSEIRFLATGVDIEYYFSQIKFSKSMFFKNKKAIKVNREKFEKSGFNVLLLNKD